MHIWLTRASFMDTLLDLSTEHVISQREKLRLLIRYLTLDGYQRDDIFEGHPVVEGWIDQERSVAIYGLCCDLELLQRGVESSTKEFAEYIFSEDDEILEQGYLHPSWIHDTDIIRSHRSNLMRRFPDVYDWPKTPASMPYLYPFPEDDGEYKILVSKRDKELLASGKRKLPKSIMERVGNL